VVYREPARGAHARVAALVDELAASEERFTPAFWALVAGLQAPLVFEAAGLARDIPSRIARPLAEALRSALALCESEEGRARIGDEAAERRALYEDVASRASALEGTLTAPLDEAEIPLPEHPTQVLAIDQLVADDAVAELSRYARRADADAVVRRDGALVWARFAHQGAPMAITVRARESTAFAVRTSVALASPALAVRPRTFTDSLASRFGGGHGAVGDEELDGALVVDGDRALVAILTEPAVRNALAALCRHDVPRLEVGGGFATLHVDYEPSAEVLDPACRALRALRAFEPDAPALVRG
jgi:hypothetical protein